MIKLSVIIPHYNSADTLGKLLDSIIGECKDIQIIVVDDRSTEKIDVLNEIRQKYSDTVEFYSNDTGNKGAGAARNVGVSKAKGEWLLFADSDDYYLDGWYDIVKDYFDKQYDLVFFAPTSVDLNSGKPGTRHEYYKKFVDDYSYSDDHYEAEQHLRYYFVVPWAKLVRASVVREHNIKFDEIRNFDDAMFAVMVGFYAKSIFADPQEIYCVTERAGSLTTDKSEETLALGIDVFCRRNLFLREHLNKDDYKLYVRSMGAFSRLVQAKRRKCGLKLLISYLGMYRKNKVPLMADIGYLLARKFSHKQP